MAGKFKLVVKDGDYGYNVEAGAYAVQDYVLETKDPVEAIHQFLECIRDPEDDDDADFKVTLTFRLPKKKGKKA